MATTVRRVRTQERGECLGHFASAVHDIGQQARRSATFDAVALGANGLGLAR